MMKLLTACCLVLVLSTSSALATVICDGEGCSQVGLGRCCDYCYTCKPGLVCNWEYTTAGTCILAPSPDADAFSEDISDIGLPEDTTTSDTSKADLTADTSIIDDTSFEPEDLSPDTFILPKDDAITDTFSQAYQEVSATDVNDVKAEEDSSKGTSGSGCTFYDASGNGWLPLLFTTLPLLALIRRSRKA